MNNYLKTVCVALFVLIMPFRHFAQTVPTRANELTIEFDITDISNFDERIFFIHNLLNDGRFDVVTSENDGVFVVNADNAYDGMDLHEAFADFRAQNAIQFSMLSKEQAAQTALEYKSTLPREIILSLMMDYYTRSRQNNTCANADPFCTDNGMYEFPAGVNAGSGESGPYYSCLYSTPNPAWYYMRILNPGDIDIYMYSTPSVDIDFCCWGPFDDPITPCPNGLTSDKVVSCSYSIYATEHCLIPATAQTGEYYILIITNYSNSTCDIHFSKVSGTGTTDCSILPPLVDAGGPYCVGETIYLTANGQAGASYSWTGPGGYSSNQQNPSRPNCTMAMAGTYTCTITVGNQSNSATTEAVVVYAQPTANFNSTTVCQGQPTQFTSTSTTNPSGQTIGSYQWNFGDGQTGSGQSTTHTYATAGTYQATLTVSTGNGHCTDDITKTVTVNPAPTASFNATTVCQGQPTQFTSTSTGQSINSYQWNFGDNQTGTGQNATHTYAQAGTYQVTLTVQTAGGCSDQITQTVTVNAAPTASFNATTVCQGQATQFTSTSTGQGINSFQWNFGDNQTGTGQNATHTYAQAGTYHVTLTVQNAGGCSDQITQTVTVNALPTASFNATTVCQGQATQFTSTSTGQGINSFQWNFGDNQTGTGQNATHTYAQAGTYQVTLTVQNAGGCSDQITQTVTVNALPTASFNATTVCQGEATQFTSTSTGQGVNSFQWNFGDNQTGTGQNATHTYAQAGTYQVTLTVQNAGGCSHQCTQTVTVNALPTASFDATTVCQGEATQFTSTSTGHGLDSFQWNFGDDQTGTGQNPSHTYEQAGTYEVTLSVQTAGGCTDQTTQTITVNALPTASFDATSVCQGDPTLFTSTSTGDQINGYQWNFGDGTTGNGETISHNYAQAGEYPVTLTVQTAGGCIDSYTQVANVYAMPVASASATPSTILYGATTTLSANAGAQGTFNFHWEPADMVANPNSQTTQTIALQGSQTFTVTITNPQGNCTSSAQVIVSIEGSGLLAMLSADKTDLCDGESTTLHVIPSGGAAENYTFQWSPAETLSNATSQNPVATPGLGNTTYSCHISDGFTDINLNITIHVHPNVEKDIYETICEDDAFSFFGQDVHTPGVYDHTLHTQYGCDSIVHLHLDNWLTYETSVSDRFCQNDTYQFFDQNVSEPGIYYHTLYSQHGCDSTIRLNLSQDPIYEFEMWESTCQGGDGYLYVDDGTITYLQPRLEPYIFHYPTVKQCDSTIVIHIEEAEYNSKNYNVSLCGTEFTWGSNGITYYETGIYYDTIHYDGSCDSTVVLNLELRPNLYDDVVTTSCDDYRWLNDNFNVDMTFTESTVYTHHYINAFGCESEATLHLTINDHDESAFTVPEEEACDEYFWDPRGHQILYTDHEDEVYIMTGTYHRTYKNVADCDSLVTMNVTMEYTPHPTPIYPMDLDNTAPHWVVTATEFQINAYDFNLWDTNPNCHWDTVTWYCDGAPEWVLEPFGDKAKCCKLYVLNHVEDTVWLTAHAFNRCAPNDGVIQRYWLVCSFYGVDEQQAQADFSVVPNPNKGQMTLNFENLTGKIKVKVYDMRGALLDDFETYNTMNSYAYTYQMRNHADGIYFFVATGKEGTLAKKVIIQR